MDPWSAPETVLRGHAPNELSKLQNRCVAVPASATSDASSFYEPVSTRNPARLAPVRQSAWRLVNEEDLQPPLHNLCTICYRTPPYQSTGDEATGGATAPRYRA